MSPAEQPDRSGVFQAVLSAASRIAPQASWDRYSSLGAGSAPFFLAEPATFSDAQNLYIVIGYGPQETGGCSIAVHELYLTDNAIVVDTELLGPEIGENPPAETSWPVVIIRTELLEQPVIFQ